MTHQNHQTNGASLEDCHTNFYALVSSSCFFLLLQLFLFFAVRLFFFFFFTRRSRSVRTQRGCSAKGGLIGLRGCVTHTVAKLNHRSWDPISLAPSPSLRLIDWQPKRRRRRSATAVYRYRRRCFAKNPKTVLITVVIAKTSFESGFNLFPIVVVFISLL